MTDYDSLVKAAQNGAYDSYAEIIKRTPQVNEKAAWALEKLVREQADRKGTDYYTEYEKVLDQSDIGRALGAVSFHSLAKTRSLSGYEQLLEEYGEWEMLAAVKKYLS